MPDFRFDPVSARWVTIASNRSSRPMEFIQQRETLSPDVVCPFCKGRENDTPSQMEVWDRDGHRVETSDISFDWTTRVVPNKFPAFPADVPMDPFDTQVLTDEIQDFGPYEQSRQSGVQELIIPTPRHVSSFGELEKTEAMVCLAACQTRISVMRQKCGVEHAMLFMNCRSAAGASLAHAHLQLIGSPIVTQAMKERVCRNQHHVQEHGQTLIQAVMGWEQQQKIRIVFETDDFCVVCPFASRVAYQIWIIPKHSINDFTSIDSNIRDNLALVCRKLMQRLDRTLNNPAYNVMLHAAPFRMMENDHWFVEITPRLTRAAGLEWGTDIWINPVSPEDAAKRLRD